MQIGGCAVQLRDAVAKGLSVFGHELSGIRCQDTCVGHDGFGVIQKRLSLCENALRLSQHATELGKYALGFIASSPEDVIDILQGPVGRENKPVEADGSFSLKYGTFVKGWGGCAAAFDLYNFIAQKSFRGDDDLHIGGDHGHAAEDIQGDGHGVFRIFRGLALFQGPDAHAGDSSRQGSCIADLGARRDAESLLEMDLEGAFRGSEARSRERKRQSCEENAAADHHQDGNNPISRIPAFHNDSWLADLYNATAHRL